MPLYSVVQLRQNVSYMHLTWLCKSLFLASEYQIEMTCIHIHSATSASLILDLNDKRHFNFTVTLKVSTTAETSPSGYIFVRTPIRRMNPELDPESLCWHSEQGNVRETGSSPFSYRFREEISDYSEIWLKKKKKITNCSSNNWIFLLKRVDKLQGIKLL